MSSIAAQKQAAFWVLKISLILMILGLTGLSFDFTPQHENSMVSEEIRKGAR